jgi:tRNA pseudouridine38-40 synthase
MPRYKLTLEYDGTPYAGWQIQEHLPTVQAALEAALAVFYAQPVATFCAGRTDAGVHALGQVVHIDAPETRAPYAIAKGLNALLLPQPIAVLKAEEMPADFDARLSAQKRHYRYRILNRPARPALDAMRVWNIHRPLAIPAMEEAAQQLIGKHDFTSFRSSECQSASPVKTLDTLNITRAGEEVILTASAKSFLHHQVRIMVGTLALVGMGKWPASRVAEALAACDRKAGGLTAPACGLYFVQVEY